MGGKSSKVAPSQVVAARPAEPNPQLPSLPASEPTVSKPAASKPAASAHSEPAASNPAASVHSEPAATEPAASEPAASEPAASEFPEPAASGPPATLELRPDKQGNPLELSLRQQQLIQLQHPGAVRVVVKKLHGGFSGSLVLQTAAYDAAGRPDEPAVTKLDTAAALVEEIKKQDSISGELGAYAIRILRRPLYLGARGGATGQYMDEMHATDADAAVVLELAGACWVLPEFFGKAADEQDIIVPFKQHLLEALKSGIDSKNVEGVFDDLYSVGGPLQRLACKATFGDAATAKGGFVATALEDICREVTRSMVPVQDAGHAAKDESAYAVPATLLKAATGAGPLAPSGEVTKRTAFERSFVHECGEPVWGDAACAPLIALTTELRTQLKDGVSWLAGWRPLRLLQHGDLNAANVLIDARGAIWLIDFAETSMREAFCDAAKLVSVLLFEYLPCDNEEMLGRGCAVVDALIPTDGARQLWEEPPPLPVQDGAPSAHALALSLAANVQRSACDLIISASKKTRRGGVAPADVHAAALWLPLLREALRCLRYRDLNVWQKRTAWHAVQRLSTALLAVLPREPAQLPVPEIRADDMISLQLAEGQLLLLRSSAAGAARLEGGSPAEVHEVKPDGLHRLLLAERMETVRGTVMAFEDMLHTIGDVLPDALATQEIRRRADELLATRRKRAIQNMPPEKEQTEGEIQKEVDKILLEDEDWAATELRKTGVVEQRRYAPGQQLSVLDTDRWRDMTVASLQEDGSHQLSRTNSSDGSSDELSVGLHAFNHAPLELSEAAFHIQRGKHADRMSVMHASIRDALSGRPLTSLEQCVPIAITDGKESGSHGTALASINDVGALCHWLHEAHGRRQRGERSTLAAVLLTAPPAAGKTCLVSQLVMHTLKAQTQSLVPLVIKVMDLQSVLLMPEHKSLFASKWNWADAYCCATLGEASPSYRFLRQALLARRALLLLDGMDEGGLGKARIERHVQEVLLPQGHPLLLTSRPDSLVSEVYEGCARLQLRPLTEEQQRAVIAGRLNSSAVPELVKYVQSLPRDTDGNLLSGNPLMLNMLISIYESRDGGMPSSLHKVYEMASGVMLGRLELKVRGGSATTDAEQLRRLLREVALEVHLQKKRQISGETLFRVAERLGAEALRVYEAVAKQLALDRMPMLSVIEHEPLVVQFSHLSFQEYFAAQAICAIQTKREGFLEPWRWLPWWGNAVRLGADCGKPFGLGLLRAAGLKETMVDFDLSDDTLAKGSLAAVSAMMEVVKASGSLKSLNVENNELGVEGGKAFAIVLKDTQLTKLNIRDNLLCAEGGKAIAAVLKDTQITTLDISKNNLAGETGYVNKSNVEGSSFEVGAKVTYEGREMTVSEAPDSDGDINMVDMSGVLAFAASLPECKSLTSLNLSDNALCGISYGEGTYTSEGITALCEGLKGSAVTSLDIRDNDLGVEGGKVFAAVLKDTQLTNLNLRWNDLTNNGKDMTGVLQLVEALPQTKLTSLNLSATELGSKGGAAIAEGLKGNTTLNSLNLDQNAICGIYSNGYGTYNAEGITKLCEGLKASAVTSLSLANNDLCGISERGEGTFTAEGITALCKGLKGSAVTSLNVLKNKLGDGADALVAAAREMPQLVTLCGLQPEQAEIDLTQRDLDAGDAKLLAFDLSKNQAIKTLNIAVNQLTNRGGDMSGVLKLAEALPQTKLTSLNLNNNRLDDATKRAVKAAAGSGVKLIL